MSQKPILEKKKKSYLASILVARLWCFLCLQVSKPQIIRLKKKKNHPKVYRLAVWKRNCMVYSLRYDSRTSHGAIVRGRTLAYRVGPLKTKRVINHWKKAYWVGIEKKKACIIYLFMHAWAIESLSLTWPLTRPIYLDYSWFKLEKN